MAKKRQPTAICKSKAKQSKTERPKQAAPTYTNFAIFESHWIRGVDRVPDRRVMESRSEHKHAVHPTLHAMRLRAETLALYYVRMWAAQTNSDAVFSEISPGSGAWRRLRALEALQRQREKGGAYADTNVTYQAWQTNLSSYDNKHLKTMRNRKIPHTVINSCLDVPPGVHYAGNVCYYLSGAEWKHLLPKSEGAEPWNRCLLLYHQTYDGPSGTYDGLTWSSNSEGDYVFRIDDGAVWCHRMDWWSRLSGACWEPLWTHQTGPITHHLTAIWANPEGTGVGFRDYEAPPVGYVEDTAWQQEIAARAMQERAVNAAAFLGLPAPKTATEEEDALIRFGAKLGLLPKAKPVPPQASGASSSGALTQNAKEVKPTPPPLPPRPAAPATIPVRGVEAEKEPESPRTPPASPSRPAPPTASSSSPPASSTFLQIPPPMPRLCLLGPEIADYSEWVWSIIQENEQVLESPGPHPPWFYSESPCPFPLNRDVEALETVGPFQSNLLARPISGVFSTAGYYGALAWRVAKSACMDAARSVGETLVYENSFGQGVLSQDMPDLTKERTKADLVGQGVLPTNAVSALTSRLLNAATEADVLRAVQDISRAHNVDIGVVASAAARVRPYRDATRAMALRALQPTLTQRILSSASWFARWIVKALTFGAALVPVLLFILSARRWLRNEVATAKRQILAKRFAAMPKAEFPPLTPPAGHIADLVDARGVVATSCHNGWFGLRALDPRILSSAFWRENLAAHATTYGQMFSALRLPSVHEGVASTVMYLLQLFAENSVDAQGPLGVFLVVLGDIQRSGCVHLAGPLLHSCFGALHAQGGMGIVAAFLAHFAWNQFALLANPHVTSGLPQLTAHPIYSVLIAPIFLHLLYLIIQRCTKGVSDTDILSDLKNPSAQPGVGNALVCTGPCSLEPRPGAEFREPLGLCRGGGLAYRVAGPRLRCATVYTFKSCPHNIKRATLGRMAGTPKRYKDNPAQVDDDDDEVSRFYNAVADYMHMHIRIGSHGFIHRESHKLSHAEWSKRYSKKAAETMRTEWLTGGESKVYDAFIKADKYVMQRDNPYAIEPSPADNESDWCLRDGVHTCLSPHLSDPRGISVPKAGVRYDLGPDADHYNHALMTKFSGQVLYMCGLNSNDFSDWLEWIQGHHTWGIAVMGDDLFYTRKVGDTWMVESLDISRYDMHIRPCHLRHGFRVMREFGFGKLAHRLEEMSIRRKYVIRSDMQAAKVSVKGTRASGDPDTISSNSLYVLTLAWFSVLTQRDPRQVFYDAGFVTTGFSVPLRSPDWDFLQKLPYPCVLDGALRVLPAPKIGRFAARAFWTRAVSNHQDLSYARGVCLGLQADFQHVPIARAIVFRVLELSSGVEAAYDYSETRSMAHKSFVRTPAICCQATLDYICARYGITQAQIERIEDHLLQWSWGQFIDDVEQDAWLRITAIDLA